MWHKIIIVGHLGKKPEMRFTPAGQAVTSFSVATSRTYTSGSGEQVKETLWTRVSVWGKAAEACNTYLDKGSLVLVEGRLTPDKETGAPRIWTDKSGKVSSSFEVTAIEVKFLSGKKEGEAHQTQDSEIPVETDIPF
jgi:single-strand DNA-binding protein